MAQTSASSNSVQSYLKEIGRISRLTREEEISLGKQVQQLVSLTKKSEELAKSSGREPSTDEWAAAAGLTVEDLQQQIDRGEAARRRMVEANLRLVVSIAKKYTKTSLTPLRVFAFRPTPTGGFARPLPGRSQKKADRSACPFIFSKS